MGSGIAQVALLAGYKKVTVIDLNTEILEKSRKTIQDRVESLESERKFKEFLSKSNNATERRNQIDFKQKLSEFKSVGIIANNVNSNTIMTRLKTEIDLSKGVADADFVIEAVPEILEKKQNVFKKLGEYSPNHTIFASNTSTMSITKIAHYSGRPEKVIGMHFHTFFPIFGMLIEITPGKKTSEESLEIGYAVAQKFPCLIGERFTVKLKKETPGFIANRISIPISIYYNWFIDRAIEKGISLEQLDAGGISFEGADSIGIDTVYYSAKYFEKYVSPDFAPNKRITKMVKTGKLGKKVGKGYYEWNENGPIKNLPPLDKKTSEFLDKHLDPEIFSAIKLNEACRLLEEGVVKSYELIDKVVMKGTFIEGPFVKGKKNYKEWTKKLIELARITGKSYLNPCELMKSGRFLSYR